MLAQLGRGFSEIAFKPQSVYENMVLFFLGFLSSFPI